MNIVLLEPEIPQNTGNIGRTCVATGTKLHMIEPLGFRLDEKSVRRAGMDYWPSLDKEVYISYRDFREKNPDAKIYMATTKAKKLYTEVAYEPDSYIMFGKESAGIPEEILVENPDNCVRIPMIGDTRSLNLSNSVAIILYEALRQNVLDFPPPQLLKEVRFYQKASEGVCRFLRFCRFWSEVLHGLSEDVSELIRKKLFHHRMKNSS